MCDRAYPPQQKRAMNSIRNNDSAGGGASSDGNGKSRPVARSGNGGVRKIINVDLTSGRWTSKCLCSGWQCQLS